MDLKEIGWDDMDWIHLSEDRNQWQAFMNTAMNLRGSIKCWEFLEWLRNVGLSRTQLNGVCVLPSCITRR
jgi:phenylalanine-4-hydroxylase